MSRSDRVLCLGVAAFALAWGLPSLSSGYEGPYDEGNTLCAAWRTAGGEIPYRDFWLMHSPGTTWLLAGIFRVFGTTVGVERATKLVVVVLSAVLVFVLARRSSRAAAAAAAAIVFVALPTQTLSLRSRDTGLLLVLATLAIAGGEAIPIGRGWRPLAVGVLAGITVWFKQDFALTALVAGAIPCFLVAAREGSRGAKARTAARDALLPLALGAAAVVAALVAVLWACGSLGAFVEQAVVFPAKVFARVRALSPAVRVDGVLRALDASPTFGALLKVGAVPLLLAAAALAGLAALTAGFRALWEPSVRDSAGLISAGIAALLLLQAPLVRADLEHLNPALALGLVAMAAAVAPRMPFARSRTAAILAAPAVAAVLAASLLPLVSRARGLPAWFAAIRAGEGATGLSSAPRWIGLPDDVARTARFLASSTTPGETIFVGNERHDALAYSAPLLYFLAGRKNATRYDNLHPGVATTRPVQEEIVRRLEERGTRWVVLWDGPPVSEPNESSVSSGAFLLDEWLSERFREVVRYGPFRVCEEARTTTALRPGG